MEIVPELIMGRGALQDGRSFVQPTVPTRLRSGRVPSKPPILTNKQQTLIPNLQTSIRALLRQQAECKDIDLRNIR